MIKQELHYQDIYMIPAKTVVGSRKECDTTVKLGNHTFAMPVYAANMKSVVNIRTCELFAERNWFYTMHRFNVDPCAFIDEMHDKDHIASISMGVNDESYAQIKEMLIQNMEPEFITLDIANAWCDKGEKMIKTLKNSFPDSFIIAGNIATGEAVIDLEHWGADACKVGIAGGSVCTTKLKTGFHRPMVNTVQDCVGSAMKPIIADGGIVHHGDIAKALALGATMVMAGGLFAGYEESAGETLEIDGHFKKAYFGSASDTNKGEYKNVEGKKIFVDYKGPMEKLLNELKEDLQSSISYSGGRNLTSLLNAQMITCNK
jgi:GMP reductase